MSNLCIGSWVIAAILLYTQRRDRRMLARAPHFGCILALSIGGLFIAWRAAAGAWPLDSRDAFFLTELLAACSGFAVPLICAWGKALVRRDLPLALGGMRKHWRWTCACALLASCCAAFELLLGREFLQRGVFNLHDMLFDSDPLYVQHGLGARIHPHTHPLLPLIWRLAAAPMALLVGLEWAALALNSVLAGSCAALAAGYFRALTGSPALALVSALILATTASHVVFGAVPESWIMSAIGLILLQRLVAQRGDPRLRRRHFALTAVLAAGVTVTNAAAALTCCTLAQRGGRSWRRVLGWALDCLALAMFAFAAQQVIVPDGDPLLPAHYFDEMRFVEFNVPLGERLAILGHGLFVQNVIGWIPGEGSTYGQRVLTASWNYDALGRVAGAAWLLLIATSLPGLVARLRARDRGALALLGNLALSAALFGYYGLSYMFLYSCTFTFGAVTLVAIGWTHYGLRRKDDRRNVSVAFKWQNEWLAASILLGFWLLLLFNNVNFARRIITGLDRLAQ